MPDRTVLMESEGWEGQQINSMAHVIGLDNNVLTVAGVSAITLSIYDLSSDTPSTVLYVTPLTVSAVMSVVTKDSYWTRNNVGYNFRHAISPTLFTTNGGHKYRFCYDLATVSWGTIWVIHEHACRGVLGQ